MKKIVVFLMVLLAAAVAAVVLAADTGGFSVGEIAAVEIHGDSAFTTPVSSEDPAVTAAVEQLLAHTERAAKLQSEEELAQIRIANSAGQTGQIAILRQGGALYARMGEKTRQISSELFYALVDDLPAGSFYSYSRLQTPFLSVNGEEYPPAPQSDGYAFRSLSGELRPVELPAGGAQPSIKLEEGEWPQWLDPNSPDDVELRLFLEGETVYEGSFEGGAELRPQGGKLYRGEITAVYAGEYAQGRIVYTFWLQYPAAELSFTVEGADTYPGEVLVLRAHNVPQGERVGFASDLPFPPSFFERGEGEWIALLPASYQNSAGSYYLELSCAGISQRYEVTLSDKEWQIQNLTVDEGTASETIQSQQANAEYERVIAPLRPVARDRQYWSGEFLMPVSDEKITTQFGMIRYVNGSPTSVRHGALDLAVPRGTPVAATNSGEVLYAGFLQLTGNTVLIEHGYGLKSWYYHMDSLSVATGDLVERGAVIGTVGSTGFSTGPHLHFGMSVNNVFINPDTVINTGLLQLD